MWVCFNEMSGTGSDVFEISRHHNSGKPKFFINMTIIIIRVLCFTATYRYTFRLNFALSNTEYVNNYTQDLFFMGFKA